MAKILVVEDEEKIARFIELELQHEGYETDKAADGRTGLEMAESGGYDLMLLDIMLPQLNGLEVLRRLRRTSNMPVIMLTARDAVMDKVSGLDMGADDYITKPFAIEELLARIRVTLRKGGSKREEGESALSACGVVMNVAAHSVTCRGQEIALTVREFNILYKLLSYPRRTFSRAQLMDEFWSGETSASLRAVDVYITRIREKFSSSEDFRIVTVHGLGYKAVIK